MAVPDRPFILAVAGIILILVLFCCAGCRNTDASNDTEPTSDQSSVSVTTAATKPLTGPTTTTQPSQKEPVLTPTAEPTQVLPSAAPSPLPTPTIAPTGYSTLLAACLADPENGEAIGERARRLNSGDWHNACVYVASEALRRVGCDIPQKTNYTPVLMKQLTERGFTKHTDLTALQPGDICFTTDEQGRPDGIPTHTFIFLGWAGAAEMTIFDNQMYDFGSLYHTRMTGLDYYMDDPARPKEATAFFMRSPPGN